MTKYNICGCVVVIPTELENERFLEERTDSLIDKAGEIFDKWYASKGSYSAVYYDAKSVVSMVVNPIVEKGIEILNENGVYSLDAIYLKQVYMNHYADDFFYVLEEMMDKVRRIENTKQMDKEYRQQRKEYRGRLVGGGFGLGGAVKGIATAGAVNATTGLAYSIANSLGNMGSGIVANSDKKAVYKNSKADLRAAIIQCANKVQSGIRDALLEEAGIKCRYVTTDDGDRADAIYKNYIEGRIPEASKKRQILEALVLNPYSVKIYKAIWTDFGDKSGDLRKLSSYFGGNLDKYVAGIAKQYGEDLFSKNCGKYESAFDKKETAVNIEQQIKVTYETLLTYCKLRNIAEDSIPIIQKCKNLLQEIELEQRKFNNVVYETREAAQSVKEDYHIFYDFLQGKDIFKEGMFEQITDLEFRSEKFKKHIQDVFDEEKN